MEVAEGYKDTKIGRIPSDWNSISFENLGDYYGGLNGKKKEDFGEGKPYIPFMNIMANDVIDTNYTDLVKIKEGEKQNLAHKGDLFFNTSSETPEEVGMCSVLNEQIDDLYLNSFCFGFRLSEQNKRIYLPEYISRFMRSGFGRKIMFPLAQGMTRYNLSKKYFLKLLIPFPPLKEQQKIVEILSTVDEQISTTQAIIDKSKELKKGLMQKLFSEGIGHTEFKDTKIGRIPKDWEVVKIGEVTKIKVGRDLKEDAFSTVKTETHKYPVFSNTVSYNGFYGGYYNFAEHEGNSLTIVGRGVGIGTSFSRKGGYGAIGRLLVLFPNDGINEVFMSYFVNHKMTIHYEDGGIPQLTGDKISKYRVAKPKILEQQKIADILSQADAKIEKEEQEKVQLEQLKKGLMQQLLTGQKRVKV